jgi:CheY-like chemotaxis protein
VAPAGETATVLLVDDEPTVLLTLSLQLRRDCRIVTAADGAGALRALASHAPVAAIICDQRMPGTEGTALLERVRVEHPDTIRILHTGQPDVPTAIAAINDGQIFRFIAKPVGTEELRRTVRDAVEQHRIRTTERELLDKTLGGSMKALFGCLEMACPTAFARGGRIRNLVTSLCQHLHIEGAWQVEVAAMACQLGAVTLPPSVAEKLDRGLPLPDDEQRMVDALPGIASTLLGDIPLLGEVIQIIDGLRPEAPAGGPAGPGAPVVALATDILRVAIRYETLDSRGYAPHSIITALHDSGRYSPELIAAACRVGGIVLDGHTVRALTVGQLGTGMRVVEDVHAGNGVVLLGRGVVITDLLIERLVNFRNKGELVEPILAAVPLGHPVEPVAGAPAGPA